MGFVVFWAYKTKQKKFFSTYHVYIRSGNYSNSVSVGKEKEKKMLSFKYTEDPTLSKLLFQMNIFFVLVVLHSAT